MRMRTPKSLAKWIALSFSIAALCYQLISADALDVVILSVIFLPWIVGPVLLAAFLVRYASSTWESWSILVTEVTVIGSTIALWIYLWMNSDAQNGIAMLLFPVVQFAGVIGAFLIILAVSAMIERRKNADSTTG
jgi:predicted membrane protein